LENEKPELPPSASLVAGLEEELPKPRLLQADRPKPSPTTSTSWHNWRVETDNPCNICNPCSICGLKAFIEGIPFARLCLKGDFTSYPASKAMPVISPQE
jgi:hypothetical protein